METQEIGSVILCKENNSKWITDLKTQNKSLEPLLENTAKIY